MQIAGVPSAGGKKIGGNETRYRERKRHHQDGGFELQDGGDDGAPRGPLSAVEGDDVTLSVQDSNSSCLIRQPGNDDCTFVVMPMRL